MKNKKSKSEIKAWADNFRKKLLKSGEPIDEKAFEEVVKLWAMPYEEVKKNEKPTYSITFRPKINKKDSNE